MDLDRRQMLTRLSVSYVGESLGMNMSLRPALYTTLNKP